MTVSISLPLRPNSCPEQVTQPTYSKTKQKPTTNMPSSRHAKPRTEQEAISRGIISSEPKSKQSQGRRTPPRREYGSSPEYGSGESGVECALDSNEAFILYIGYVHSHIPAKMVFSVFRKLGIGKLISGDDAVTMIHRQGRNGQRDHQSVKVAFEHPFLRGRDGATNAGYLNHIMKRDETGAIVSTGDSFQLVYQEARTNRRTGKDEPDRHWEVRYWSDAAPAGAGKSATARPKVTLVQKATATATAHKTVVGADGFRPVTRGVRSRGQHLPRLASAQVGDNTYGGSFAGLHQPESPSYSPTSPVLQRQDSKDNDAHAPTEQELDEAAVAFDEHQSQLLTQSPTSNADGTLVEVGIDGEIQAAGDEFFAESAVAEAGAGNLSADHIDPCDLVNATIPLQEHYGNDDPNELVAAE